MQIPKQPVKETYELVAKKPMLKSGFEGVDERQYLKQCMQKVDENSEIASLFARKDTQKLDMMLPK